MESNLLYVKSTDLKTNLLTKKNLHSNIWTHLSKYLGTIA